MLKQSENYFHKLGHLKHARHVISYQNTCQCYQLYFLETITAFGQCHFKTKLLNWIVKPENAFLSLLSKSHSSWICDSAFWKQRLVIEKDRDQVIKEFHYQISLEFSTFVAFIPYKISNTCIVRKRWGRSKVWLILLSTEKTFCVCTQKQFHSVFLHY